MYSLFLLLLALHGRCVASFLVVKDSGELSMQGPIAVEGSFGLVGHEATPFWDLSLDEATSTFPPFPAK